MTARRHLHTVEPTDAPPPDAKEELRQKSAKAGKHIGDAMRAHIQARDWGACHVRGDRAQPLFLGEAPKRLWRL